MIKTPHYALNTSSGVQRSHKSPKIMEISIKVPFITFPIFFIPWQSCPLSQFYKSSKLSRKHLWIITTIIIKTANINWVQLSIAIWVASIMSKLSKYLMQEILIPFEMGKLRHRGIKYLPKVSCRESKTKQTQELWLHRGSQHNNPERWVMESTTIRNLALYLPCLPQIGVYNY